MTLPPSGTSIQTTWCHARLGVKGDTGHHLCDQAPDHDGPHTCDACDVTWVDGDSESPVVEERFDAPGCQMCGAPDDDSCDCHDPQEDR